MRVFVYHTVKLFSNMGAVRDHKRTGRPHMVCTPQVIKAHRSRINENHVQKQRIMTWEMDISLRTMSHIIKYDLGHSNDKQDNLPLH
jgi:hypothetical protein